MPVWQPTITSYEKNQVERVHKCALCIIFGESYLNFTNALEIVGFEKLEERRIRPDFA